MGLDINQRTMAWNSINLAKAILAKKESDSPESANYILRDLDATKEAGLSDLSWSLHKETPHENDVLGLIEYLENYLLLLDDIERENLRYPFITEYKEELNHILTEQVRKIRKHFNV